jgi:hypothetical protein
MQGYEKCEYYMNIKRKNFEMWHFMENEVEIVQQVLKI